MMEFVASYAAPEATPSVVPAAKPHKFTKEQLQAFGDDLQTLLEEVNTGYDDVLAIALDSNMDVTIEDPNKIPDAAPMLVFNHSNEGEEEHNF